MNFSNCRALKDKDGKTQITLTDLDKDSGYTLDAVAYAVGSWTSNDLWENNSDYLWDVKNEAKLNWPGWDNAFRDLLDSFDSESMRDFPADCLPGTMYPPADGSLSYGDDVRLNHSRVFAKELEKWKEYIIGIFDDDSSGQVLQALADYVEEAHGETEAELLREWLKGDYHGSPGVLREIKKFFDLDETPDWNPETDCLFLTFSPEQVDEMIEDYNWQGTKKEKDFLSLVAFMLETGANDRAEKDKREVEKQKAERVRLAAYKAEQASRARALELAEAKERKAKIDATKS